MLEFINVNGNNKHFSLDNISFRADTGYITGIVGKNGAGKSTLFRYIYDDKIHYTGEILYNGENIRKDFPVFKNDLAIISDEKRFFQRFSSEKNAQLTGGFYNTWDYKLFQTVLKDLNVSSNTPLASLSRGEYIKFQLAYAVAHDAKLYLLDEATAGMDPVFRREFFKFLHSLIAEKDVTILMSSHIEEDIKKHMDYTLLLENGKLISFEEVDIQ